MGRWVAMWLLTGVLLSAVEWLDPADQVRAKWPGRRELVADVCWAAVYLASAPLLGWMLGAVVPSLAVHAPAAEVCRHLPFVVQLAISVLAADLVAYGVHRLAHRSPALWRLHRVHHSSATLRWWSTFRFHPLESALAHIVPLTVVTLAGAPRSTVGVYLAAVFVVTVLAHADVFVPRSALDRVVVLPAFHRVHHQPDAATTNFGLVLPIWDQLFGTAHRNTATPAISDTVLTTALDTAATSHRT
jgi:sterol desaturase/sphingolipid hydroxylase (fatty acid hydroxylase superfamily)